MNAVIEHRIGLVRQLGVDETSLLAASRHHTTVHTTPHVVQRSAGRSRGVG